MTYVNQTIQNDTGMEKCTNSAMTAMELAQSAHRQIELSMPGTVKHSEKTLAHKNLCEGRMRNYILKVYIKE